MRFFINLGIKKYKKLLFKANYKLNYNKFITIKKKYYILSYNYKIKILKKAK